ncbi:uncharacterized protein TNCV_523481 [Trichonephila clavipes]|nr:uncharacterized protein TNCV_523481 [Trichonephila clavipes]
MRNLGLKTLNVVPYYCHHTLPTMWEALNTISLSIWRTMCESGHRCTMWRKALAMSSRVANRLPRIGSLILGMRSSHRIKGAPAQVSSSSLDHGLILRGRSSIAVVQHYSADCGSPVVKVSDHARHVMSSSPVPLKTRHVGQRCTINLSRAETSSHWCGVVVMRGGYQLRCRSRHLTMVQNDEVRHQKHSCS